MLTEQEMAYLNYWYDDTQLRNMMKLIGKNLQEATRKLFGYETELQDLEAQICQIIHNFKPTYDAVTWDVMKSTLKLAHEHRPIIYKHPSFGFDTNGCGFGRLGQRLHCFPSYAPQIDCTAGIRVAKYQLHIF